MLTEFAGLSTLLVADACIRRKVSMTLGGYVSVSSQRDTERSLLAQERRELADAPDLELAAGRAVPGQRACPRRPLRRSPRS